MLSNGFYLLVKKRDKVCLQLHNISLLYVNFDESIIRLYFLLTSFILAKFLKHQKSITMSSITCLNLNFCSLKLCMKNKFMDWIVNNIKLVWNLTCMLTVKNIKNMQLIFKICSHVKFFCESCNHLLQLSL